MDSATPQHWNGQDCLYRMTSGCIAKVRTLERDGQLSDVDAAHIRDRLLAVLREIGKARWLGTAMHDSLTIEGTVPLPTEACHTWDGT